MATEASFGEFVENVRTAVSVELTTLPTYLYPYWSIRPSYDGGTDAGQHARTSMMSVILEEMLHMGLVSNLLNAVGAEPDFTSEPYLPTFPGCILRSPTHGHHGVEVDLLPLGEAGLTLLCRIELPGWDHPPEGMTIGEFYHEHVIPLLPRDHLVYRGPEGHPRRQLAEWDNPGAGRLFDIVDHESAYRAIMEILHQGEGLSPDDHDDGDHELAHYWRFRQLLDMWKEGSLGPDDVYPIVASPHSALGDYSAEQLEANRAFNLEYSRMLDDLEATLRTPYPDVYPAASGRMSQLQQLADQLRATGYIPGREELPGPTFEYIPAGS